MPGPVPKRSEERIRRNKPDIDLDSVRMSGLVEVPELGMEEENFHPWVIDFYESLKQSGQSKFYEPSDWQIARLVCVWLNTQLKRAGHPSAMMIAQINTMLTNLLVTEGDRRRVRMEVERQEVEGQLIDVASLFREQFSR